MVHGEIVTLKLMLTLKISVTTRKWFQMCGDGRALAIPASARSVNSIIACKRRQRMLWKWIHSSDGLNQTCLFSIIWEASSRTGFIYNSKYKRSDPSLWKLSEKVLSLVAAALLKPFLLFEGNANPLPPSNYAIDCQECFEMKWFDPFSPTRTSSIGWAAEGNNRGF